MKRSGKPAHSHPAWRLPATCLLGALLALLAACGQRGPLYLPDEHPDAKPAQEQADEVSEDEQEGDDSA